MKELKRIILISLFIILPFVMGACADPAVSDNNADMAVPVMSTSKQYTPGDCFIRNNCKGNAIANVPSQDECIRRNGNSWINEQAECIIDIDQD